MKNLNLTPHKSISKKEAFVTLQGLIDEIESECVEYSIGSAQVDINHSEGVFAEVAKDNPWHVGYWNRNVDPPVFYDVVASCPDLAMEQLSLFMDNN